MPVIRISDRTYKRIQMWATPLVDTPDSALAKVFDAVERRRPGQPASAPDRDALPRAAPDPQPKSRTKAGGLSQKEFRRPLMEVLYELGGKGHAGLKDNVRAAMEKRMEPWLSDRDREITSTNEPRWWSTVACGLRERLKKEGLIRDDSKRGIWKLSEAGIAQVESWLAESRGNFSDHLLAMPDAGEDADFNPPRSGPREIDA